MIADSDESHPRDSRILSNYSMDDIDKETLIQYRRLFANLKPSHPWLSLDDLDFLTKLEAYRRDRHTKEEGFTLAGILMFGKTESITDPECAPNYFPDYREHLETDISLRWSDRICPDGTWEANLFQFYRKVYPKLTAILPKPFQIKMEYALTKRLPISQYVRHLSMLLFTATSQKKEILSLNNGSINIVSKTPEQCLSAKHNIIKEEIVYVAIRRYRKCLC